MTRPTMAEAPTVRTTIPQPRIVRERAVRRGRLGVAIALMAVFALAAAALYGYVSKTLPYLAVAKDVQIGARLTADDLVTIHINPDPGLSPVPASHRQAVIGKYASIALL